MVVYALPYASFFFISFMLMPNYSLSPLWIYPYFTGIFLADLQGQTWFAHMVLTIICFPLCHIVIWRVHFLFMT